MKSQLRRYTSLGEMPSAGDGALLRSGGLVLDTEQKTVTVDGQPVKMTPIEYRILKLLLENQNRVFSIDEIYEQVWNEPLDGAEKKVVVHISHLREKIEINPKDPKYLKVVWGIGYKIEKLP